MRPAHRSKSLPSVHGSSLSKRRSHDCFIEQFLRCPDSFVLIVLFLHFVPLWSFGCPLLPPGSMWESFTLVGMRLRRVVPSKIVLPLVKANKAGLDVNVDQLEAHYLAGGDVDRVVDALIAAERAAIPLPLNGLLPLT